MGSSQAASAAEVGLADSPAFKWTCEELERQSDLDRFEARGTVRIALRLSGLTARSISADQMQVVVEKVLPAELLARGIEHRDAICSRLVAGLEVLESGPTDESPDEVFRRLGGS